MIGTLNIGAVQSAKRSPKTIGEAADYALALISGWTSDRRDSFAEVLEDLKATAAHNEEVRTQAAEAVKQLNAAIRDHDAAKGAAEKAQADLKTQSAITIRRQTERESALADAEQRHAARVTTESAALDARGKALAEAEARLAERQKTLDGAEEAVSKREAEVSAKEAHVATREQRLKDIVLALKDRAENAAKVLT